MNAKAIIPFLLSVIVGCSASTTDPTEYLNDKHLIPLQKGNFWIRQLTFYDSLGRVTGTYEPQVTFIDDDTMIGTNSWYIVAGYSPLREAYRNAEDGIYTRLIADVPAPHEVMYFPYPADIGQQTPFPHRVLYQDSAGFDTSLSLSTLMSLDTTITTRAGTFNCVQFRVEGLGSALTFEDHFLAPGYGWIRMDLSSPPTESGFVRRFYSLETIQLHINN